MTKPSKRVAMAVMFGLVLSGRSQSPGQDRRSVPDEAGWRNWVAQAREHLARELGYPAPAIERVEMVTAARSERWPADPERAAQIEGHLRLRFPHLDATGFADARADALAVDRQTSLARIVPGTTTLLIDRENALAMSRWHESLSGAADNLIKLAVIHELARGALEARYPLERLRAACREADAWFALQAVVEGRAQWLTKKAAGRLGLADAFPLLAQRLLYVPDVSPEPSLRTTSQSVQRDRHWACVQGLEFWTHMENAGQTEKTVFARLPRQVQWIQRPELYRRALASARVELTTVLSRLEGAFPATEWASHQQAWTPDMVMQAAALLGDKGRAEKAVTGWDEGRSLLWTSRRNPNCLIAVSVVRYESAAGARGYYGFALDLQRKRDELSNTPCKLPMRVVESKIGVMPLTGVDDSTLLEKRMELPNSRDTMAMHTLLVRRGDEVIEITWHGLGSDPRWAQWILDGLHSPAGDGSCRTRPQP